MTVPNEKLNSAWWGLKVGLGAAAFLAGLDKFFNLLAQWEMYLSSWVERLLPVPPGVFMSFIGVVEMIVGLAILTRWTRLGSYAAMGWLVVIAVNLVSTGMFFDLAVRDLVMAVAAYALARLTEVRQAAAPTEAAGPASAGT